MYLVMKGCIKSIQDFTHDIVYPSFAGLLDTPCIKHTLTNALDFARHIIAFLSVRFEFWRLKFFQISFDF